MDSSLRTFLSVLQFPLRKKLRRAAPMAVAILALTSIDASALATDLEKTSRKVTKVVNGVFLIQHADSPDGFPQGNTTVVIGERSVLVVDSCYLPSSAREDIAEIRKLTDKPVKYLVNTHWHYDHTMGNGAYYEAFPDINIVAHVETARQSLGYNPGWFLRYAARTRESRRELDRDKTADGKQLTAEEKRNNKDKYEGLAPVQTEFEKIVDRAPNITFETEVYLDLGNRLVEIRHLGRGNSAGDAVVVIPKEKILVAGDLVVHPVPYFFGGYPVEFIATLRKLSRLIFQTVIPGHGGLLRGNLATSYIDQIADLLGVISSAVSDEVHRNGSGTKTLEAARYVVKKSVDLNSWRQKFAGKDKEAQVQFDESLDALITYSFMEIVGR